MPAYAYRFAIEALCPSRLAVLPAFSDELVVIAYRCDFQQKQVGNNGVAFGEVVAVP